MLLTVHLLLLLQPKQARHALNAETLVQSCNCSDPESKVLCWAVLQDLYASSQQMTSGIGELLETALSQGRAVPKSSKQGGRPDSAVAGQDHDSDDEEEDEMMVARLSNAAALASSILATHGHAEVTQPYDSSACMQLSALWHDDHHFTF